MAFEKVAIERLDVDNYATWNPRVKMMLVINKLWKVVELGPAAPTADETEASGGGRSNDDSDRALALIGMHVADHHLPLVSRCNTAKELWDSLSSTYRARNQARVIQLRRELQELRLLPGEPLTKYFARAAALRDDLKSAGHEQSESEQISAILTGLPDMYDVIVTVITASEVELTLESILSKLLPVEHRLGRTDGPGEVSAHSALHRKPKGQGGPSKNPPARESHARRSGHRDSHRPAQDKSRRSRKNDTCNYCGKVGHWADECHQRARDDESGHMGKHRSHNPRTDPRNYTGPRKEIALSAIAEVTETVFSATSESSTESNWLIDSGASRHLTRDKTQFLDLRDPDHEIRVVFGNGKAARVEGIGRVKIECVSDGNIANLTLSEALYVPEASANLFSVRSAAQHGADIAFSGEQCRVRVGHDELEVVSAGDVFYLSSGKPTRAALALTPVPAVHLPAPNLPAPNLPAPNLPAPNLPAPNLPAPNLPAVHLPAMVAMTAETAELWHRRFGHLGYDNMHRLAERGLVEGIDVDPADFLAAKVELCEPCVLAKQAKQPFPDSDFTATRKLELVHMDVLGPLPVASLGGAKYVATFLDEFSKVSVVKTVQTKAEVPGVVEEVLQSLENQSGERLKAVRSDRGSEYLNRHVDAFLKRKGVEHQTSAPYTPQQNGAAERLNRTLMERARAMLIDAGLPDNLWAEAVTTANYIRNRSPAAGVTTTPYEAFYDRKPDVSAFRVFGAAAYAQVPSKFRNKLEPTSVKGIMVGYELHSKAYRVFREDTQKVIISREVVFDENHESKPPGPGQPPATGHMVPVIAPTAETPAVSSTRLLPVSSGGVGDEVEESESTPTPLPAPALDDFSSESAAPMVEPAVLPRLYPVRERRQTQFFTAQAAAAAEVEPATLEEALASPHADEWRKAMADEMDSLRQNGTWTLETAPMGFKPIPVKWVFKIKRGADGKIERYKARLVAKGFKQVEGVDYTEVFAPVSKHGTLRAFLALVAERDLELEHLDVKTAFLNGDLEEEIYMQQPPGFEEGSAGTVCRLRKTLYGLKQAPRAWHIRLKAELEKIGFRASDADPGLYVLNHEAGDVYLLVYVDDLLPASSNAELIGQVKAKLKDLFDIRDLGPATYFLGMEILRDRSAGTLKLVQRRMTAELAAKYGLAAGRAKSTPLAVGTKLYPADDDSLLDTAQFPYSELVGSLLYLAVCTRPDIAQSVGALARYMAKPAHEHWQAAKGVVRYLACTADFGVNFGATKHKSLIGYCDADYAGDLATRRSTTGYVFILNGGAITWSSRLQKTVAVSTAEAEYMAAAGAVKEALWLKVLMRDFGQPIKTVPIKSDNQAAIRLLQHPMASERSKHIDIIYHFARERVAQKEVSISYVSTEDMVADSLTKPLPEKAFARCREGMGVYA
jgi:hypothetical protein